MDRTQLADVLADEQLILPLPNLPAALLIPVTELALNAGYANISLPVTLDDDAFRTLTSAFGSRARFLAHGITTCDEAREAIAREPACVLPSRPTFEIYRIFEDSQISFAACGLTPNEIVQAWDSCRCAGVQVIPANAFTASYAASLCRWLPEVCLMPRGCTTVFEVQSWLKAGASYVILDEACATLTGDDYDGLQRRLVQIAQASRLS